MNTKPCTRCLAKGLSDEDYQRYIIEYIEGLDPGIKADEALYQSRLSACMCCKEQAAGLCRVCGCFIEVRAIKLKSYCPAVESKW